MILAQEQKQLKVAGPIRVLQHLGSHKVEHKNHSGNSRKFCQKMSMGRTPVLLEPGHYTITARGGIS